MTFDARNKEVALKRLKRLAISGLPLEPLVRAIWGIMREAIPHSPHMSFLPDPGKRSSAYLASTEDVYNLLPAVQHYFVNSPPEVSGYKLRYDSDTLQRRFPRKTIWVLPDLAVPNFYRTEGYNEVFGKLGRYDGAQISLQEDGIAVGHYPIWHTRNQRPFDREDLVFLKAVAPPITHALKVAQTLDRTAAESPTDFVPLELWGQGVILLDRSGDLVAIDEIARAIFRNLATFDGVLPDAFLASPISDGLKYITQIINDVFYESSLVSGLPLVRFYSHWTGAQLKLRGVLLTAGDGREYVNVLVERGEGRESRRRRTIYRWGLTAREAHILDWVAEGKTNSEIATIVGASKLTVKKHLEHIIQKLGVETRTAAAAILLGTSDSGLGKTTQA
jgi:DNA-binding CsgD family transcriptional regulator